MGPPGTERNWLTTGERGGSVVGANEDEDGRFAVLPLDCLQWVGCYLEVSKLNPVPITELVFRVAAAMNDTAVAQLTSITLFPVNFVSFLMTMKLTVDFLLSLSSTRRFPPL